MTLRIVFICLALFAGFVAPARAQDDPNAVPSKDVAIAGQPKQRYFLIGDTTKAPEAGFGLVLVMPGGDGSAGFHPFVKNMQANALPEGYLVAQLVAVESKNKNQIVWPTARSKDPKQTFTTESFIANVVKDVKETQKVKIDPAKVLTLSWSSGGPAAYAASLAKDTPITGSLVAMSVFIPGNLKPDLKNAKGKRYYLLQSPQDQVTKYSFREVAKKTLTDAGADVQTADYEGGHGWHGDVFGNIRAGIEWLDAKVQKANEK